MNIIFVLDVSAKMLDDIMAVPEECVNYNGRIHCKKRAVCDGIGDRKEQWRILLVLGLIKFKVSDDTTEVVRGTSVVEWQARRYGHKLRVEHVLGYGRV